MRVGVVGGECSGAIDRARPASLGQRNRAAMVDEKPHAGNPDRVTSEEQQCPHGRPGGKQGEEDGRRPCQECPAPRSPCKSDHPHQDQRVRQPGQCQWVSCQWSVVSCSMRVPAPGLAVGGNRLLDRRVGCARRVRRSGPSTFGDGRKAQSGHWGVTALTLEDQGERANLQNEFEDLTPRRKDAKGNVARGEIW